MMGCTYIGDLKVGHIYVTTRSDLCPKFWTQYESGPQKGRWKIGKFIDDDGWIWFEPGTILTYLGHRTMPEAVFLYDSGKELRMLADPLLNKPIPIIPIEEWHARREETTDEEIMTHVT